LKEADAAQRNVARDYAESLTQTERDFYQALPDEEQEVFRICLDLSLLEEPKREPLTFYFSFEHLGVRLGIHAMSAQRIIHRFINYKIIELLKKGTRREKDKPGECGSYKWLLRQAQPERQTS
jgi:hypothetical protein